MACEQGHFLATGHRNDFMRGGITAENRPENHYDGLWPENGLARNKGYRGHAVDHTPEYDFQLVHGGGIGIMNLAMLSALGMTDIHAMNKLKVILGGVINGVATVTFIASKAIFWPQAIVMIFGSVLGGYSTAHKIITMACGQKMALLTGHRNDFRVGSRRLFHRALCAETAAVLDQSFRHSCWHGHDRLFFPARLPLAGLAGTGQKRRMV